LDGKGTEAERLEALHRYGILDTPPYAGALVLSGEGLPVGTVCMLDQEPRDRLTVEQGEVLLLLARQVTSILEFRRKLAQSDAPLG
jgi:GAF domain-containing protein